jgi:hypothetical protein
MPSRETPHVSSRAHVDLFSFSSPSLSSYHVVLLHSDTIGLIPDGSFSPSTLILQVVVTQHVIQSQKEVYTTVGKKTVPIFGYFKKTGFA